MTRFMVRPVLVAFLGLIFTTFASAQSDGPALSASHRIKVSLDDGSTIAVDNASAMSDAAVGSLVLTADRSTRTGSPYTQNAKGLFCSGDRIFVSDYYLAWFDYTIQDGVPAPPHWVTYSRSGTLAGLWSLDPATHSFRYPYSTVSKTGKDDGADGISSNWARNELIPGSDSPTGQDYWWDRYGPPVAHTIVIPLTQDASKFEFLGSVYAQKFYGGNFQIAADGRQQGSGVHYRNQFTMTSWRQTHATFPSLLSPGTGHIDSSVEYICHEKNIEVLWKFSSNITVPTSNVLVYVWVSYTGQTSETCTHFPVPPDVYGFPHSQSPYQYAQTDWSDAQSPATPFPWDTAIPCSRKNVGVGVVAAKSPLAAGSSVTIGETPDMSFSQPRWQFVSLAQPNAGSGTQSDPIGFPFDRLGFFYENSDQTYGIGLMRGPYLKPSQWFILQGSKWYQVHYTLSTSF